MLNVNICICISKHIYTGTGDFDKFEFIGSLICCNTIKGKPMIFFKENFIQETTIKQS